MSNFVYEVLTRQFFSGKFMGQLNSIYRDRESRENKVEDFKKAIAMGDVVIPDKLTKMQIRRLDELDIKEI